MSNWKFYIFCLIILSYFSCRNEDEKVIKRNVIAICNDSLITLTDVDRTVKQELYEQLYKIYIIRKTAIDYKLENVILEQEANKLNLSKAEYLNIYFLKNIDTTKTENYLDIRHSKYIPDLKRTLTYYDADSPEGKKLLVERLKYHFQDKLIDSLKKEYNIKTYLKPPMPPKIYLNNQLIQFRGNLESKITLIEVSDLECDRCREYYSFYENIYLKYKDKVRFGFSHYAPYPTMSAIATESAAKQDKFWEMRDSLMTSKLLLDTNDYFLLAKKLNLNVEKFKTDYYDKNISEKLERNFEKLESYGFYATPTILVNDVLVFNSSSQEEIEKLIEMKLDE